MLLETRNTTLQDMVNNKSETILNLMRQIEKMEGKILKAAEADIITKEKLKDQKAKYTSLEEYLAEQKKYKELNQVKSEKERSTPIVIKRFAKRHSQNLQVY